MEYNAYFFFVLIAIVGLYLLDLIANWLNLKALRPELPGEFENVFDAQKYSESQTYTRATTAFSFASDTAGLIIFLGFWLAGGFGWLDEHVRSLVSNEVLRGVVYIGILIVTQTVIAIPFELYDTFVIEEKFGFNKTTMRTFFVDHLKSMLLLALLGLPVLALLIWLFENPNAWIYAWISLTLFMLFVTYVAPTAILPLFNKFEPLEDGELKLEIDRLSVACDFPVTEVSVMDGSKRSTKTNAIFTGFGKNKRIALYDTLIKNHTVSELVAVLAHEIGHFKRKHILQSMVIGILQLGVYCFLIGLFVKNEQLMAAFGVATPSVYCSLIFFMLLLKPISFFSGIAMNMFSRKNEFEADAYAAQVTKSPNDLVLALKKLSKDNLSNLTPHPFYVFLFYSHPPMIKRIAALRNA